MNEGASHNDGGPADAAPAMDANRFPGEKSIRQPGYKAAKEIRVHRNMCKGKWIREKIQSDMYGCRAFVRQAKWARFPVFQQGNQRLDAAVFQAEKFFLQPVISLRTKDDGQLCGRIAFDPEDVFHNAQAPTNL
jgi:hypothetical protein